MPVEPEMARWIFASVEGDFGALADAAVIPMYTEGQKRETNKKKQFIEFRMDGPDNTELSKGFFELAIEINILLTQGQTDTSYHDIYELAGTVQDMFKKTISVFRYGDRVNDDDSFVGCLVLQQNLRGRKSVETNHFGLINPKDAILQATVEAEYRMQLTR